MLVGNFLPTIGYRHTLDFSCRPSSKGSAYGEHVHILQLSPLPNSGLAIYLMADWVRVLMSTV